ncbi:unnamed protein product [Amoebophrya sp. A120]|nr:unnamed protein product [Amoebophrya sp. A120]|eukprot:GSA120T00020626001.1
MLPGAFLPQASSPNGAKEKAASTSSILTRYAGFLLACFFLVLVEREISRRTRSSAGSWPCGTLFARQRGRSSWTGAGGAQDGAAPKAELPAPEPMKITTESGGEGLHKVVPSSRSTTSVLPPQTEQTWDEVLLLGKFERVTKETPAEKAARRAKQRTYLQGAYEHVAHTFAPGFCKRVSRLGPGGDGGKNVCADQLPNAGQSRNNGSPATSLTGSVGAGDPLATSSCLVYSLGSRLDFSFEAAVVRETGCAVATFDCTVPPEKGQALAKKLPGTVNFHPWCVGESDEEKPISSDVGYKKKTGQFYTLETIQRKLGHERVDLLKMDIERSEFGVVKGLRLNSPQQAGEERKFLPRQILMETHLHDAYNLWGGKAVTAAQWSDFWQKLRGLGYRVIAHEPNPVGAVCHEWSVKLEDQ